MLGCVDLVSDRGMNQPCDRLDRPRRLAGTVEPRKIRLFAEPDQLAPRVSAILLCDERARRRLVAEPAQVLERLAVHEPAERTRICRNPTSEQCPDFIEQTAGELLIDAPRAAVGALRRRPPQRDGRGG